MTVTKEQYEKAVTELHEQGKLKELSDLQYTYMQEVINEIETIEEDSIEKDFALAVLRGIRNESVSGSYVVRLSDITGVAADSNSIDFEEVVRMIGDYLNDYTYYDDEDGIPTMDVVAAGLYVPEWEGFSREEV